MQSAGRHEISCVIGSVVWSIVAILTYLPVLLFHVIII